MMNKILTMSLLLAAGLLSTSCVKEEEDLFDKTAAERLNEMKSLYSSRLEAQPAGWAMQYYPTDQAEVPFGNGYLILCDFNADHSVKIGMRNSFTGNTYKEETSVWEIITDNGPVLSFNSYNSLFHIFSSPEDVAVTQDDDETGTGIGGDYEFVVVDAPEDASYMMLKGKKRGTYNLLTPLEEGTDFETYLGDVATFTSTWFPTDAPNRLFLKNKDKAYGFDEAHTTIPLIYPDGSDPISTGEHYHFLITKRYDDYYLRFREKISVGEDEPEVQDFRYDRELDRFVSVENSEVYITGEDPATFFYNQAVSTSHRWQWDARSEMSDKFKTYYTNVVNNFTSIGYRLNNMVLRQLSDGNFILRVSYRPEKGNAEIDFKYNIALNDGVVSLQYVGPKDEERVKMLLADLPELVNFLNLLGQNLVISPATTGFNQRYLKVAFQNDPEAWFVTRFY